MIMSNILKKIEKSLEFSISKEHALGNADIMFPTNEIISSFKPDSFKLKILDSSGELLTTGTDLFDAKTSTGNIVGNYINTNSSNIDYATGEIKFRLDPPKNNLFKSGDKARITITEYENV